MEWHDNVEANRVCCIISHLNNFLSSPLFLVCVYVCDYWEKKHFGSFYLSLINKYPREKKKKTIINLFLYCILFYLSNLLTILLFFCSFFRHIFEDTTRLCVWLYPHLLILCEKDSNKGKNESTKSENPNIPTYEGLIVFFCVYLSRKTSIYLSNETHLNVN